MATQPQPGESPQDKTEQKFALLFCAYNEATALPGKLKNLRQLKAIVPALKIYAYSDGSDDGTDEMLMAANDLLEFIPGEERMGKVRGMQKLVAHAKADVLVFTDANTLVEPSTFQSLLNYFDDPEIGAVAGTLLYLDDEATGTDDASQATTTAQVGGLYWKLEEKIKQLESLTGSTMGADGAIFARRGPNYPQIPAHMVDDMAVSMHVIFDGMRCISAPDVFGYERSVSSSSEEFRRKRRIACGSYSTYRFLKPQLATLSALNKFKFISHKLLRWWGGFALALSLLFLLLASMLTGNLLLTMGLLALGLALAYGAVRLNLPLLSSLAEITLAVIATAIGVIESLSGKSYATWSPAKSR